MFRKWMFGASVVLALVGVTETAHAALITRSYDFSASFTGAPFNVVMGSFTITLDPAIDATDAAVDAFSINLARLETPGGTLFNYDTATDELTLFDPYNSTSVFAGTDDFRLRIGNFTTASPTFLQLFYSTHQLSASYDSIGGSISASSIPEPASLLLFGVGLAALPLARRSGRSRQKA